MIPRFCPPGAILEQFVPVQATPVVRRTGGVATAAGSRGVVVEIAFASDARTAAGRGLTVAPARRLPRAFHALEP